MTNFERIKVMSLVELAAFLEQVAECSYSTGRGYNEDCANCEYAHTSDCYKLCPCHYPIEWLESEVKK